MSERIATLRPPPPADDHTRTDSQHDLRVENRALRKLLSKFTRDAAHNELVMHRCQQRELELLSAQDLPDLLERLTTGLRISFELDMVQLVLFDPYGVLEELLTGLGVAANKLPYLRLERDMRSAVKAYPDLHQPWLGRWDDKLHCQHFPPCRLRSVALLPLRQPDGLSGFLHLGSRDAARFHAGQGTTFLARLARVAAVCLENAVNRERLRLTGLTDSLTGLYNRRHLDKRVHEEIARACRHRHPLSCLFIDADHFKRINDDYGHAAGDQVLIALAKRIREQLRGCDLAARYGGEEIAVLLPQTDAANARLLAERIREHIAASPIPVGTEQRIEISVSIGVSELQSGCDADIDTLAHDLLDQADRRVYQAKRDGRNCVR